MSRVASRSTSVRRLSPRSLPRASASSSFTFPSLKYMRVGTSVCPFSRTFPTREAAIAYCEKHGLGHHVVPAAPVRLKIQAYADNFR